MRFYASILLRFYVLFVSSCGILWGQLLTSSTTPPTTNLPRVYTDFPDEITVPCRVPSFIKILPVHFRRQLRKIWSGVPSTNSDCTQQLIETHQLIDSLPVGLKLKMAEFGEEKDRFRANFFSELLPEEKAEFGEILKNISLNATEKAQLLKNWAASRLSIAAMENLEEYLHAFIERDRKFQEKIANLSQEAKDAYERIQTIRKEKQSIFARLSEKAKKELVNLFKSVCTTSSKPNMDFKSVQARNIEEDEQPLSPVDAAILSNEPFHADPLEKELSCFGLSFIRDIK
uniref:SXP/RAL-2 family protein Ani s 5-like cation-binding domain-containing protein n=1 Tax=Acrobeloides nanus TaxID=290746 RepID=A0A914ESG6_9BILA